jgi:transposase
MAERREQRRYSVEFRIEIAERMLAGENVTALSRLHQLPRSGMYRWRDAYRREGMAGLSQQVGRPSGAAKRAQRPGTTEEALRQQIAELERKVGQQTLEIDFFRRVFKRVEELPKASRLGGKASTRKSGG